MTSSEGSAGKSRPYRDIALSALGPLCAFLITLTRFMSGQATFIYAATPLFFAAVLMGAAFAGRWSALATAAIAALGLLLGTSEDQRGPTITAIAALIGSALLTGELRDRAERAERATGIANARLRRVSLRDSLTGLLDRRGFELAIGVEIARQARRQGTLAVLLFHLPGLTTTNEHFGHSVGETLVQVLADAVERRVRQSDVAARVADDQIAVILPDTDARGAAVMASHVVARFREDLRGAVPSSLSPELGHGIAVFPADGKTMDELLATAGRALRGEVSSAARS